ncbi:hypothetical protein RQ479_11565 [Mesorhizobium sp. ISC25]|uniref:hypothetical protein n=1 Tax=Mesorhizobium sp. ISC25 TaxID=3077335 RepID=UPI0035D58E2C
MTHEAVEILVVGAVDDHGFDPPRFARWRGEYVRQMNKLDSERQIAALGELQEAYMNLVQISARLEGTAQKLALTGQAQSTLLVAADRPDITVHRKREEGAETLPGSEVLGLAPSDVVEIVLPKADFAGAVASSPRVNGAELTFNGAIPDARFASSQFLQDKGWRGERCWGGTRVPQAEWGRGRVVLRHQ